MIDYMLVGLGGFVGSGARLFVGRMFANYSMTFPFGILVVNVVAAVIMGFVAQLNKDFLNPRTALFVMTGILGGFSTFSAFSLDTMEFIMDKKFVLAAGNIILNVVLCLVAIWIGMNIAKTIKI